MDRILHIDLTTEKVWADDYEFGPGKAYGRGLVLELLEQGTERETGRYDEGNVIVLAPGYLVGCKAPSATRMFVATLDGAGCGMQIANVTGNMPQKLGSLGCAAVVIHGRSAKKGAVISIDEAGVRIGHEPALSELRAGEIIKSLRAEHGRDSAIIGITRSGDMKMSLAGFFMTYPSGSPVYHCPRSSFGDVWGDKNIRAVVVNAKNPFGRECAEPDAFWAVGKELTQRIVNNEICGSALPGYGSITLLKILKSGRSLGDLSIQCGSRAAGSGTTDSESYGRSAASCGPACASKSETSSGVPSTSETSSGAVACGVPSTPDSSNAPPARGLSPMTPIRKRKSGINTTCAPMCVIGCLNRHASTTGHRYSSPAESEVGAALEQCFGIDDPVLASEIQQKANEIGIIVPEYVTAARAFAEANGIVDAPEHLIAWLDEIEKGTVTGRVLASRTSGIAKLYGDRNLAPLLDRRAIEDENQYQVELGSQYPSLGNLSPLELLYAQIFVLENLGLCIFTSFALLDNPVCFDLLARQFSHRSGFPVTAEDLLTYANQCIEAEKSFDQKHWRASQTADIPQFTKVLYIYFDKSH